MKNIPKAEPAPEKPGVITVGEARGCATAFVGFNALFMGLVAFSFSTLPHSSAGQELWYSFGSIAFFLIGAALPGAILIFGGRSSRWIALGLVVWMFVVALCFVNYLILSTGGV